MSLGTSSEGSLELEMIGTKAVSVEVPKPTKPTFSPRNWADLALLEDFVLPLVRWASFLPILRGNYVSNHLFLQQKLQGLRLRLFLLPVYFLHIKGKVVLIWTS